MSSDIIEIAIEKHRAIRPDNFICPNAALADISKSVLTGVYTFKIEKKSSKGYRGYYVNETITIYDHETREASQWKSYSELDLITHNALVSHYVAGNRVVSLDMLCRAMNGNKAIISPEYKQCVKESLLKLMGTVIRIKGTENGKEIDYYDNLIHAKMLTSANINGQAINEVIAMLDEPVLYTYSQLRRQIVSYPVALLSAGGKSSTRSTIIKHFLMRRIEQIKNPKSRMSEYITYDSIYGATKAITKKEKQNTRILVHKLLDDLIQQDYISDYKVNPKGNNHCHSIQIFYKGTPLELVPVPHRIGTYSPETGTYTPIKTIPKQLIDKEVQEMTKTP